MLIQTPSFKDYLRRREIAINAEKFRHEPEIGNLFNEKTFYRAFTKDMLEAEKEVIIYSPFVAKFRTDFLKPTIEKLTKRNIQVFVFTRPIEDYEPIFQPQIRIALERYEEMGVCVFFLKGFIHEKVAVIDRKMLWEGSLNILSQRASREMMRRTPDENSAMQVISYLELGKKITEGYKLRYERLCRNLIIDSRQNAKLKILIFLLGLAIPTIAWLLIGLVSMVSSTHIVEFIMNMVRFISK